MPSVTIKTGPKYSNLNLPSDFLLRLGHKLRRWVADDFTCDDPKAQLTEDEVEVEIENPDKPGSVTIGGEQYDIKIIVVVRETPSRKANAEERTDSLRKKVKAYCDGPIKGFVWVQLPLAVFSEF